MVLSNPEKDRYRTNAQTATPLEKVSVSDHRAEGQKFGWKSSRLRRKGVIGWLQLIDTSQVYIPESQCAGTIRTAISQHRTV